jgi:hypothetical protein
MSPIAIIRLTACYSVLIELSTVLRVQEDNPRPRGNITFTHCTAENEAACLRASLSGQSRYH